MAGGCIFDCFVHDETLKFDVFCWGCSSGRIKRASLFFWQPLSFDSQVDLVHSLVHRMPRMDLLSCFVYHEHVTSTFEEVNFLYFIRWNFSEMNVRKAWCKGTTSQRDWISSPVKRLGNIRRRKAWLCSFNKNHLFTQLSLVFGT